MIPKHKRAKFIEAFGEKKTKAIEDILDTISKAADDAGIEQKEAKSLANLFADTVFQAAKERRESEMIYKEEKFDVVKLLKGRISGHKEKAAPPAPAGPSDFAPRTIAGVAPLFGGPANVTKESPQDVNILDAVYGVNQSWGKTAPKNATVLDFLFGLNQQYGKGDKR